MKIRSSAFDEGGRIPKKYTCDGDNVSPPLEWEGVPEGTESLVVICDDPDAPMGTWVHWLVYDLPPDSGGLPENILPETQLNSGAKQGMNDFQKIGYGGPCPPSGEHRYFFKLYALSKKLDLDAGLRKPGLVIAMEQLILDHCVLMGRYSR